MSIVVLESRSGKPNQFANKLVEPLVFTKDSMVSFANLTMYQLYKFMVVAAGPNDQCTFGVGVLGPPAVLFTASPMPGVYDHITLRTKLEFQ